MLCSDCRALSRAFRSFARAALSDGTCRANLPPSFPVAIDIVSRAALDSKSVAEEDWDFLRSPNPAPTPDRSP